jgi:hypothetical protein
VEVVLVAGACLLLLLLALGFRSGSKQPPLDREAVRRIRRFADQMRREELLPYE